MQPQPRLQQSDTIVARSTPPGAGAIAIVRLSGPQAQPILLALSGQQTGPAPYHLGRRTLRDAAGRALDDALVVHMPAPNSYTGEDLVELHLHGGPAVVRSVLTACRAAGARDAEPGEFTLRAFLRGRMDLAQAEAVGALVHSEDEAQQTAALSVLAGSFSGAVGAILHDLSGVAAAWLAGLDFPDDTPGVAEVSPAQKDICAAAAARIADLNDQVQEEITRGRGVVLMGAVNLGKSTLLNAWAGRERALVDAEPGTTRDLIEVPIVRRGERFSVWDTAGQRTTDAPVEARGMAQAHVLAQDAALVVWLVDAAAPLWPPSQLQADRAQDSRLWLVGARADLYDADARAQLTAAAVARGTPLRAWVSGQAGEGVGALADALGAALAAEGDKSVRTRGVLANGRHRAHLGAAGASLAELIQAMDAGMPLDILLTELQAALRSLAQILGQDVDAGVIDRIFHDFCIGK